MLLLIQVNLLFERVCVPSNETLSILKKFDFFSKLKTANLQYVVNDLWICVSAFVFMLIFAFLVGFLFMMLLWILVKPILWIMIIACLVLLITLASWCLGKADEEEEEGKDP